MNLRKQSFAVPLATRVSDMPCCHLDGNINNISGYVAIKHPPADLEIAGYGRSCSRFSPSRRVMDIKTEQTVLMTFSLPESSTPTTWTTPEASQHYFNYFPSSCHHLSSASRGAPAASGRAAAIICLITALVSASRSGMVDWIVAVNPVARDHARTRICRR